jgi:hypothetical protein
MARQQPIAAPLPIGLPYFAADQSRAAFSIASVGSIGARRARTSSGTFDRKTDVLHAAIV